MPLPVGLLEWESGFFDVSVDEGEVGFAAVTIAGEPVTVGGELGVGDEGGGGKERRKISSGGESAIDVPEQRGHRLAENGAGEPDGLGARFAGVGGGLGDMEAHVETEGDVLGRDDTAAVAVAAGDQSDRPGNVGAAEGIVAVGVGHIDLSGAWIIPELTDLILGIDEVDEGEGLGAGLEASAVDAEAFISEDGKTEGDAALCHLALETARREDGATDRGEDESDHDSDDGEGDDEFDEGEGAAHRNSRAARAA